MGWNLTELQIFIIIWHYVYAFMKFSFSLSLSLFRFPCLSFLSYSLLPPIWFNLSLSLPFSPSLPPFQSLSLCFYLKSTHNTSKLSVTCNERSPRSWATLFHSTIILLEFRCTKIRSFSSFCATRSPAECLQYSIVKWSEIEDKSIQHSEVKWDRR